MRTEQLPVFLFSSLLAWCLCLTIFAPSVSGQANTGIILGTITDTTGAFVPDCKVTVTNVGTGVSKEFVTDATGNFRVSYLIPGTYQVTAEVTGFKRAIQTGITLQVDQKAAVNLTLEVGAVSETVEVSAQAPLLQTQSVEQGQVITRKLLEELPLNIRDYAQLATLQTGTVIAGGLGQSFGPDNPQATGGGVRVNGLGQDANNWQVDGVSNTEAFFSMIAVNPSLDSIREFKVITNNYSAEFGRAGGANVQAQIKSGSNEIHGGLFEFLRNEKLDANSFFGNRSGSTKNPFRQNQFGAFVGGPIVKDKTFFFADFEILRTRESTEGIVSIPTDLQRQGIFTELKADGNPQPTIYDQGTGLPYTNNTIPLTSINPTSAAIMALFPSPNIAGAGLSSNFFGVSKLTHNRGTSNIRVDHNFSESDQFFSRYTFLGTTRKVPAFLGDRVGGEPFASTADTRNQNGVISWVHTFSPTAINELRIGINRVRTDWDAVDADLQTSEEVGIPGINAFCGFCGGLPRINVAGLDAFGHTPFAPTRRHETIWQFVDNATIIRGKHTFKFGVDLRHIQANLFQTPNPVGQFIFDSRLSSDQGDGGIGVASFLLGFYDSSGRAALQVTPSWRTKSLFFFGQDDFRVSPNLTLNLGLRYEIYTPATDVHDRLSNFDLATGNIVIGCVAVSCTGGLATQYGNLAPRVGFAYTPEGGKTTIRVGAGISYFPPGFGFGALHTLPTNYPFIDAQAFSVPDQFTRGRSIDQGFPPLPPVEQRPGAPAGNLIPKGGTTGGGFASVFWHPKDLKMTRVYQWSVSVQRQLTPTLLVDAAYVANSQNFLRLDIPGNIPLPGDDPTGLLSIQERRPYFGVSPDLARFEFLFNGGRGNYQSFQLKVDKRFSRGFSFLAGYTASKILIAGPSFVDFTNYLASRGPSGDDAPQRLFFSYVYELPVGKGRHFGSSWGGVADGILGGWQVAGITNYQSGFPFTPSITSNLDNGQPNRPNRICDGELSNRTIEKWFNPSCFEASMPNVFGNTGTNVLRGPTLRNWDLAIGKNFKITETIRLQFRTEFLNAWNQVAFGNPNANVDPANDGAGTIRGVQANTFPRRIQFGLKMYF